MPTWDLLSPGAADFLLGYHDQAIGISEGESHVVCDAKCPTHMRRLGLWMPSLTQNSKLVQINMANANEDHIFTPRELYFAMGWPTIRSYHNDLSKWMDRIMDHGAIPTNLKALGNGMHLVAEECWCLYVTSNIIRRDVAKLIRPPVSCFQLAAVAAKEPGEDERATGATSSERALGPPGLPLAPRGLVP